MCPPEHRHISKIMLRISFDFRWRSIIAVLYIRERVEFQDTTNTYILSACIEKNPSLPLYRSDQVLYLVCRLSSYTLPVQAGGLVYSRSMYLRLQHIFLSFYPFLSERSL